MKRGIFFAFLCAASVGAVALTLVTVSFLWPRQAQRWLFAPAGKSWFARARSNAEIVAQANQAVVTVIATRTVRPQPDNQSEALNPQQNLAPPTADSNVQRGTGTGFLIDDAGYIVTNDHVIRGADRIRVRLADGRERRALVQGADAVTDIALLKIEAGPLPLLQLGDSDELRVGDAVIAIGNPLDYEHSVTAGIISAKGRKVYNNEPFEDFIQTDAAINRGNSGGPLLNQQGEVIGVNTVIRVDGSGISFAVPSNVVRRVIAQLRLNGTVKRGYLGLTPATLTAEFRDGLGLGELQGVLVADVTPDKPAAKAGVEAYDVLTHFDGRALASTDDFFSQLSNVLPHQTVALTVLRGGKTLKLAATLEERSKSENESPAENPAKVSNAEPALGFSVRENALEISPTSLTAAPAPDAPRTDQAKTDQANHVLVAVIDPLGPAADSGLTAGQIILEANRQPIHKLDDFNRVSAGLQRGNVLILRISAPQQRVIRLVAIRVGGE
ncbi:MAG: trypsin-like peptidase domain-containing protein [Acidobacteria bacterium]|nr:trypsin-like peptidase domain-containing protein [Acidobacteriota bacterium]MBI3424646.1 trypsin-like peptidase domain-containing protein [Acidobacteriota bacterium]